MGKLWNVKETDSKEVKKFAKKNQINELLASLLMTKNITSDNIESYLNPTVNKLYAPNMLNDIESFVARVLRAKERKEKVVIYGDYDVDGITSIYIMYDFLKSLGIDVSYYLPDRKEEGYGLNIPAIDEFKKNGYNLIITVDCGISAVNEAIHCKEIGIDLIITDHHECTETLPQAIAVIDPKRQDNTYPFRDIAGVGVAFKCITALAEHLNLDTYSYFKYMDIVCLGTVADIVPLLDENRIIVYNGLKLLAKTKNYGLRALIKVAGIATIDSDTVSFGLAPRMNASGRMADASLSVKMLCAENEVEAYEYAKVLDEQNKQRQLVEKKIFEQAIDMIEKQKLEKAKTIVLYNKEWHQGVIGIVACKLVEKYLKPVFLLAGNDKNIAKGSGRTPQGISLYEALTMCEDSLISFGGHELAAGLNIHVDKIDEFKKQFEQSVTKLAVNDFVQLIDVDLILKPQDVNYELIKSIAKLAPFGQKNRMPVFMLKSLKVVSVSTLKEGKHLKLLLQDSIQTLEGLYFNGGARRDEIAIGDKLDIVGNISVNAFRGEIKIQYILCDFKKGE